MICSKALRCPKCYSYSTDELRMCHIQPECKFPRFTKRLLLKCAKGDLLTKLQNKYRRKIKQLSRNKLVIHLLLFAYLISNNCLMYCRFQFAISVKQK